MKAGDGMVGASLISKVDRPATLCQQVELALLATCGQEGEPLIGRAFPIPGAASSSIRRPISSSIA